MIEYAELHCLSNLSFLEAASHPQELVQRAEELGYSALAITDRNSLAGVVRAHTAAKEHGLKLVIGAEIVPDDAPPVVLWAINRAGYGRLCRLITVGRRRAPKGECLLTVDDIAQHADNLFAGVIPPVDNDFDFVEQLRGYRDVFGDRCSLLAEFHRGVHDQRHLEKLQHWEKETAVPLVAAGGVLFHSPARQVLQDTLTAIRLGKTVAETGEELHPNAQRHLKQLDEIQAVYGEIPGAIKRAVEIAQQCRFSLDELRYEYPEELAPTGQTPLEYLSQLTWDGAQSRYPEGVPDKIKSTIKHELQLIKELRIEAYFLTVWDLVRFARSRGILCQGRGSAANSVVCFCLGVTEVDPNRIDVLFERFVSKERDEAPDIDIDFEHERREEVLQYIYDKYGRERAGMTGVTITYKSRSAIRDVGKALGLSLDLVDRLAKNADGYHPTTDLPTRCREMGFNPESKTGRRFVHLVETLIGFPRHLSQHVGGMVMTRGPLHELVPIENAAMPGRTVIEWNKDDLDDLGILKVDCLSLGMLTAIRKCFALVQQSTGKQLTLANIPADDSKVYDMVCAADTVGVFQIESRGQMSMLPRLKPRCFYDLVIEVAIVRPGPIQGDMVHPYLRRRKGEEPTTYPNEAIREVLKRTLGVPLFQEQCMRLAVVAAGFTPGEADQLRRAMGAWRRPGIIEKFREKLISGMQQNGLTGEFAEQVFRQISGFGEYGFPESHAASFALLVYASAYLKCYYPAEFAAAIINSQPMGFYAPAQLVQDAQRHGVEVLPVDVNQSCWDCTIENSALRMGLRMIVGFSVATAQQIEKARQGGLFRSMDDFCQRTRLSRTEVTKLAEADAFASLGQNRRQALWNTLARSAESGIQLFDLDETDDEPFTTLPSMPLQQEVHADYQATHLTLRPHPVAFHRKVLKELGVMVAAELKTVRNFQRVKVAGLVLMRQRPSTAKGITFVTIEDETGTSNLLVHQKTWETYRNITRHSPAWIAHGRLETKDSVIHVIVHHLEDMSKQLGHVESASRNFR